MRFYEDLLKLDSDARYLFWNVGVAHSHSVTFQFGSANLWRISFDDVFEIGFDEFSVFFRALGCSDVVLVAFRAY
jgi:hypothetical protein